MTTAAPATLVLDGLTLTVLNVGLACCAVEAVVAALEPAGAVPYAPAGRDVQVLLVSGTVTTRLGPLVQELHASLPGPVRVVAFGACASSGGPYWDSYSVVSGIDQLLPVDLYVPGCPPPPQALLDALRSLSDAPGGERRLGDGLVRPAAQVGPQDLRARPLP